ncbi:hypothetical protein CVU37_01495 [candidate division BRC1 bacterium HGW-BRC1-1]|nr:MAG: hypothetical protein CVU37_01495 [candidate division BRC1 bacterium HGW-BRC1-1]
MWRHYRVIGAVYALLFLVLFSPWNGQGYDDTFYFSYLTSPTFDQDLRFENDFYLSENSVDFIRHELSEPNERGHLRNLFALGTSLLWLPFFLVVRAAAWIAQALPGPAPAWSQDRYSAPYLWAVSLGTLFWGMFACLLMYETCRLRFRPRVALHASLGMTVASPLLGYIFQMSTMSHAASAFAVALLLFLCFKLRHLRSAWSYIALGLALGLVTLVRWQDAIFVLIPAGFFIAHLLNRRGSRPRFSPLLGAAMGGLAFLMVMSLQFSYWKATLGRWITMPQPDGFMHWTQPEIMNLLFSGWNGAFYWHPLLLVGALGLMAGLFRWRWSRLAPAHWAMVATLLVAVYVNSCVEDWYAGASFGMRRFCSIVPLLALGLAAVYSRLPRREMRLLPLWTGLLLVLNLVLLTGYQNQFLRPFFWTEIGQLGADFWNRLPAFLPHVVFQHHSLAEMLDENRWLLALALLGSGVWVMVAAWWLWTVLARKSRWLPRTKMIFLGCAVLSVVAVDVWFLTHATVPDPRGLAFSEISPRKHPYEPEAPPQAFADIAGQWVENPVAWLTVLKSKAATDAERKQALWRLKQYGGKLWSKAVFSLPQDSALRRVNEAEANEKSPRVLQGVRIRILSRISEAKAFNHTRLEQRYLRKFLRAFPFHFPSLLRVYDIQLTRGDKLESRQAKAFVRRILQTRWMVFVWKGDGIGRVMPIFYYNYVKESVQILDRIMWGRGDFQDLVDMYRLLQGRNVITGRESVRLRLAEAALSPGGLEALVAEAMKNDVDEDARYDAAAACRAMYHPELGDRLVGLPKATEVPD